MEAEAARTIMELVSKTRGSSAGEVGSRGKDKERFFLERLFLVFPKL